VVFAVILALWVAPVHLTVNAEGDQAIGRGFTGSIADVQGNSIIVQTQGPSVQVFIDENTKIEAPPNGDLGIEFLREKRSARVAVLADREVTAPDGAPNGQVITGKKIMVIPTKAARSHRRAVTTENGGGRMWALDTDGRESEVGGGPRNDVETGESVVLLVRAGGQSGVPAMAPAGVPAGIREQILTYVRSAVVDQRLERLSGDQNYDPLERAQVEELKHLRESAKVQRLERTADNANAAHRDMVRSMADQLKEIREGSATVRPISECAETLLGRSVGSFSELTEQQQGDLAANCLSAYLAPKIQITSPTEGATLAPGGAVKIQAEVEDNQDIATVIFTIDGIGQPALTTRPYTLYTNVQSQASSIVIEATAFDEDGNKSSAAVTVNVLDAPPTIKITKPFGEAGAGPIVTDGYTITISADVTDDVSLPSVVFTVNGEPRAAITKPPYSIQFTVPATPSASSPGLLKIAATATDSAGNFASDTVSATVALPTAPKVRITQPAADAQITEGERLLVTAETDNDNAIVSVTFTIDGLAVSPVLEPPFSYSYLVPGFAPVNSAGASKVPPHVFVSTASINGELAPDGTVVVAYVDGSRNSSLVVRATATNHAGQTGTASLSVPVSSSKIKAGEALVSGGKYLVNTAQANGASHTGKRVTFTVAGAETSQSGIWRQGGADLLDLTSSN
jgi:hypothetical protein